MRQCITDPNLSNIDNIVENIDSSFSNAVLVSTNVSCTITTTYPAVNEDLITIEMIDSSVKNKPTNMWREILTSLDSKRLWNQIDWNGYPAIILEGSPDVDELVNHYQEKGQSSDNSTLLCEVNNVRFVLELDSNITSDEVNDAINKLKHNKSTGDGWSKYMLLG